MEAASPVYTPAVLQGEPPPWAHPTPSPSPMIRFPAGPDGMGAKGRASDQGAFTVPEDLLWEICSPYIQDMIVALQRVIQKEVQALLDPSRVEGSPSQVPTRPGMAGRPGSLSQMDAGSAMPFGSLLNPTLPGSGNRVPARRGGSDTCEPLHEEAETLSAREGSSRMSSPLMPGVGETFPQKIAFHRTSKSLSPMPTAPEPSTGPTGGSHRASPAMQGLEPSSMQAVLLGDSGAQTSPAARPCYVMPSEQNQRLTPTVSPQIPLGYSAGSIDAGDGEKSVMVCRHWKSKGWCRLEAGCKFLHPDSKRGTGVPPKKSGSGGKEGAGQLSDVGTPPGNAAGVAGIGENARSAGTRPSRRSGRGRNNRGSGGTGSQGEGASPSAAALGLVQGGATPPAGLPLSAAPGQAQAMQGAPAAMPRQGDGRHDR